MLILDHNWPDTLRKHVPILEQRLEAFDQTLPVNRVLLFGSHAKKHPHKDSDVDLCIIADEMESQHRAAIALRKAIGRLRGKPSLTLIPISEKRLFEKRSQHDPFYESVLSEGICVAHREGAPS